MKKLLIATALCAITAISGFAQGTMNVSASSSYPLRISNGSVTNTLGTGSTANFGIGPGSALVQLWVGPATATSLSQMFLANASIGTPYVTNTSSALAAVQGSWSIGNPETLSGYSFGTAQGDTISWCVVAWTINTGATTYAQAIAGSTGYAGQTAIYNNYVLAGGATTPTATFGANPGFQAQQLVLNPVSVVPEPSTFALAGLGLAGLLIFRRRK